MFEIINGVIVESFKVLKCFLFVKQSREIKFSFADLVILKLSKNLIYNSWLYWFFLFHDIDMKCTSDIWE